MQIWVYLLLFENLFNLSWLVLLFSFKFDVSHLSLVLNHYLFKYPLSVILSLLLGLLLHKCWKFFHRLHLSIFLFYLCHFLSSHCLLKSSSIWSFSPNLFLDFIGCLLSSLLNLQFIYYTYFWKIFPFGTYQTYTNVDRTGK